MSKPAATKADTGNMTTIISSVTDRPAQARQAAAHTSTLSDALEEQRDHVRTDLASSGISIENRRNRRVKKEQNGEPARSKQIAELDDSPVA